MNILNSKKIFNWLTVIVAIGFIFCLYGTTLYMQSPVNTTSLPPVMQQAKQGLKQLSNPMAVFNVPGLSTRVTNPHITIPFSGFIENRGQEPDPSIRFYYVSNDSAIGFGNSVIYFSKFLNYSGMMNSYITFNLTFSGSNKVQPTGVKQVTQNTNYFIGQARYTDLSSYAEIWYYNLYPNIDLRYYITPNGLKYDFIILPGGNPANIILDVSNNMQVKQQINGMALYSNTGVRSIYHPFMSDTHLNVYTTDGTTINATFRSITGNQHSYGFALGSYNLGSTVIIDPVWLGFSTYVGGSSDDSGSSITVDSYGNTYVTGYTQSIDFPMVGAYNSTFGSKYAGGNDDVFVFKLSASGNSLIYSTYVGGNGFDDGFGITVDSLGVVYVTGSTSSSNFPTVSAYNSTFGGFNDVFMFKLSASGHTLIYSTYVGGNDNDYGNSIALGPDGTIYVTGVTFSGNFPTVSAYNSTYGGNGDVFILRFPVSGNGLIYSTFVGGNGNDYGSSIAVDSSGSVYVTGTTYSSNFPTKNAYNSTFGGNQDVFVFKLFTDNNTLFYSTFVGGSGNDAGNGIAVDSSGNAYVTGFTDSGNFPTKNAYNSTHGRYEDVFVFKLSSSGNSLIYSTFVGGNGSDAGNGIAVDSSGNAYVTGATGSSNFPTKNAYNSTFGGNQDVFVFKLSSSGNSLVYSTFVGGSGSNVGNGIAVDSSKNVYVTGATYSSNFPTKNAYQATIAGSSDVFVLKVSNTSDDTPPSIILNSLINASYFNSEKIKIINFTITDTSSGVALVLYRWDASGNSSITTSQAVPTPNIEGLHTLHVYAKDIAGNWNNTNYTFIIDNTPPNVTYTGIAHFETISGKDTITITPQDANGISMVEIEINGVTTYSSITAPYSWTWNTTTFTNGLYTVNIVTTDVAGNANIDSFQITITNVSSFSLDPISALGVFAATVILVTGFVYWKSFSFRNRRIINMYRNDMSIENIAQKTGKGKRHIEEILHKAKKMD